MKTFEKDEVVNRSARSIAFIHFAVWTIGGTIMGAALGGSGSVQPIGAASYTVIAGIIGRIIGRSRAASFRLQAATARGPEPKA